MRAALLGAFLSMCDLPPAPAPTVRKSCTQWVYVETVVADDGTRCRLYERTCGGETEGRTNCPP